MPGRFEPRQMQRASDRLQTVQIRSHASHTRGVPRTALDTRRHRRRVRCRCFPYMGHANSVSVTSAKQRFAGSQHPRTILSESLGERRLRTRPTGNDQHTRVCLPPGQSRRRLFSKFEITGEELYSIGANDQIGTPVVPDPSPFPPFPALTASQLWLTSSDGDMEGAGFEPRGALCGSASAPTQKSAGSALPLSHPSAT